jgi:hypothetical protein
MRRKVRPAQLHKARVCVQRTPLTTRRRRPSVAPPCGDLHAPTVAGSPTFASRAAPPQGAYGIICEVEGHPFDIDTMLFMDWRDDHLPEGSDVKARNAKLPTFLYAMPFSKNK